MNEFKRADLRELLEQAPSPGISIYLPTHRAGRETQQDRIRLKNLLVRAGEELSQSGVNTTNGKKLLDSGWALVDDTQFWQNQRDGLALFLADGFVRRYRLPLRFPERAKVGPRFYIKPLLPMLTEEGHYYVLALSQKEARLYLGTRDGLVHIEVREMPEGLVTWVGAEARPLTHHITAGGTGGSIMHGSGGSEENRIEDLKRYFREIDRAVAKKLRDEHAPMVLATVESQVPVYREVSDYPQILPQALAGNPDVLSAQDLHARSWSIVRPFFAREMRHASERFNNQLGTGQTSTEIETVLKAAYEGRVDYLFVATGVQLWGAFDPAGLEVAVHPEPTPQSRDLLDLACEHTLKSGGKVYALNQAQMPSSSHIAAGFRY
jgi:hypothetical protein